MATDGFGGPKPAEEARLDSWKEIAAHLKRGVTTVQRWERTEGLPVHRLPHSRAGSVYAYQRELDDWWRERSGRLETGESATEEAPADDKPRGVSRFRTITIGLAGVALAAGAILFLLHGRAPATHRAMLAVLPFQNLSASGEDEYLANSMTEELTTVVARLNPERLGVIARTSVMPYKAHPKPVSDIGRGLQVDYVLEGSVRQAGGRVRVTAQVIEVGRQSHLWAEAYEKDLADIFRVEAGVAESIAGRLSIRLLPGPTRPAASPDPDAHAAYLKGLYFWNKRNEEGLRRAIGLFRQAIDAGPGYARAHAGLASSYALLATSADALRPAEARDLSVAAARRALELDPQLPEGHAALSVVRCRFDWNWPECKRELTRTITLDPNYATGHFWLGEYLIQRGRFPEAEASLKTARTLDPISPVIHTHLGITYMYARRYDEALASFGQALEISPRFLLAHRVKGLTLVRSRRHEEGLAALRQARGIDPGSAHAAADLGYGAGPDRPRSRGARSAARADGDGETPARLRLRLRRRPRGPRREPSGARSSGDRLRRARNGCPLAQGRADVRWTAERAGFRALVARIGLPD